jgi:hypothetical protein
MKLRQRWHNPRVCDRNTTASVSHDISSCDCAIALNRKPRLAQVISALCITTMSSTPCHNGSAAVPEKGVPSPRPTAILHRTPWRPPVAVSGQGIYITLEGGREVIDAVGGAAVTCIGNGHPVVREAIKEQVDKLACEWPSQFQGPEYGFMGSAPPPDVYNMQLSNEPAEELARILIDSGKGAFELCGFFAGGACVLPIIVGRIESSSCSGSEAMEGALKLARQVSISFGILVVF